MEIVAMSELYNIGIKVWQLDPSGKLKSIFDNTSIAVSKGLGTLHLSRHRGVHFNNVIQPNQKLPLLAAGVRTYTTNTEMKDAHRSLSLSNDSLTSSPLPSLGGKGASILNASHVN